MATTFVHRVDQVEIITRDVRKDGFQFRSVVCYRFVEQSAMQAVYSVDLNAAKCVVKHGVEMCDDIAVDSFIDGHAAVNQMLANEPTATIRRPNPHHKHGSTAADTLEIDTPDAHVDIFLTHGAQVIWCYKTTAPPNADLDDALNITAEELYNFD